MQQVASHGLKGPCPAKTSIPLSGPGGATCVKNPSASWTPATSSERPWPANFSATRAWIWSQPRRSRSKMDSDESVASASSALIASTASPDACEAVLDDEVAEFAGPASPNQPRPRPVTRLVVRHRSLLPHSNRNRATIYGALWLPQQVRPDGTPGFDVMPGMQPMPPQPSRRRVRGIAPRTCRMLHL